MRDSGSSSGNHPPCSIRRLSEQEALLTWNQLARGDWAVLDRIDDGNGRRFVLARRGAASKRPWHRLSEREMTVVAAVAAGRTNREIAGTLGVSTSTVASHLRSAKKKLGGVRRLELVREWGPTRLGVRGVCSE